MVSRRSGAAPDRRSHRRQRGIPGAARWDTPKVVKGVSFLLRLTVQRMTAVSGWSARPGRRKPLTLHTTGSGELQADSPGSKCVGQQGDPASVSFRIAAPAAPSGLS